MPFSLPKKREVHRSEPPVSDCQKSRFAKNSAQKVFAGLFQKAADSKGRAFGRVPQDAKSFAFIRIRKGDATARWAVASWETLSRGFPMRRLTPHLGNLLSANQFFYTLKRVRITEKVVDRQIGDVTMKVSGRGMFG